MMNYVLLPKLKQKQQVIRYSAISLALSVEDISKQREVSEDISVHIVQLVRRFIVILEDTKNINVTF